MYTLVFIQFFDYLKPRLYSLDMEIPYINTRLPASILLTPEQVSNGIYLSLRDNLARGIKGKNYKRYGYVVDIYKIDKYKENIVEAERLDGSVNYSVEFTCRLCRPIQGMRIVCRVNKITRVLLGLTNGPITILVTQDRVNKEVFFRDSSGVYRYRKTTGKSGELLVGDYVAVTLGPVEYAEPTKILALAFLDNILTETEARRYFNVTKSVTRD